MDRLQEEHLSPRFHEFRNVVDGLHETVGRIAGDGQTADREGAIEFPLQFGWDRAKHVSLGKVDGETLAARFAVGRRDGARRKVETGHLCPPLGEVHAGAPGSTPDVGDRQPLHVSGNAIDLAHLRRVHAGVVAVARPIAASQPLKRFGLRVPIVGGVVEPLFLSPISDKRPPIGPTRGSHISAKSHPQIAEGAPLRKKGARWAGAPSQEGARDGRAPLRKKGARWGSLCENAALTLAWRYGHIPRGGLGIRPARRHPMLYRSRNIRSWVWLGLISLLGTSPCPANHVTVLRAARAEQPPAPLNLTPREVQILARRRAAHAADHAGLEGPARDRKSDARRLYRRSSVVARQRTDSPPLLAIDGDGDTAWRGAPDKTLWVYNLPLQRAVHLSLIRSYFGDSSKSGVPSVITGSIAQH